MRQETALLNCSSQRGRDLTLTQVFIWQQMHSCEETMGHHPASKSTSSRK